MKQAYDTEMERIARNYKAPKPMLERLDFYFQYSQQQKQMQYLQRLRQASEICYERQEAKGIEIMCQRIEHSESQLKEWRELFQKHRKEFQTLHVYETPKRINM